MGANTMIARPRFLLAWMILATGTLPVSAQEKTSVTITAAPDHLDFAVGSVLVTRYHVSAAYSKPIFWPVRAPNGAPLTRSWPLAKDVPGESTDHVHQKSAWFCHGDVVPEGMELKDRVKGVAGVDFWSEAKGHGNIVCTKVEEPKNQGSHARVTTHNEWRMADGTKIMDEKRVISLRDFGNARLIILDI